MRRFGVGLLLMLLPVGLVSTVKKTSWGPILSTPQARQIGDPKAKVVIVEYSDFQCPSCAHIQPTVHQFLEMYKGKIRLVYKYYPLTKLHKNAMSSAQAAQCAAVQNQFWPYADQLFSTQLQWADLTDPTTSFMAIAKQVELDIPRFTACLADPKQKNIILQDAQEGKDRDINSTPTFIVGEDRLVGGVFASDGARAIERALWR